MFKRVTTPRIPSTALGFSQDSISAIELTRRGRALQIRRYGIGALSPGTLVPAFDRLNILDESAFRETLNRTMQQAGLSRQRRWSVALPEAMARTAIISLESVPSTSVELSEMIGWKTERMLGISIDEVRVAQQRLSAQNGQARYLVTATRREVIEQYEKTFAALGWRAGLILPRPLAEAQWLGWNASTGVNLLVSSNEQDLTLIILRNGEPLMIRTVDCEPAARHDELFRVLQYYRDRLMNGSPEGFSGLMVVGAMPDTKTIERTISDALEQNWNGRIIDRAENQLTFEGHQVPFDQLAAAAGLAASTWL